MSVGKFLRELTIIDLIIVPANALFGHAGGAAGFENIEGPSLKAFWHPDFIRQIAQPFILKVRKLQNIRKTFNLGGWVPARLFRPSEPEGRAGFRRKMPLHDLTHV